MLTQKLDIWNQAIGHLGESIEIGAETENTAAARACRRFYDTCREKALRDAPWPFAKGYVALAQITGTIPVSEFKYAYRYPVGVVTVRRILNGIWRVDDRQSAIPYRVGSDGQGLVILTDFPPSVVSTTDPTQNLPWVEVTKAVTDETLFPSDFVDALSFLLALRISPRVAGDKSALRKEAIALYQQSIARATANAFNEEQLDDGPASEFERSRDGWNVGRDSRRLFEIP